MNTSGFGICQIVCWVIAAVAGLLVFWMAKALVSGLAALMLGLALAVFLGLVLTRLFCEGSKAGTDHQEGAGSSAGATPSAAAAAEADTAAADKAAADKAAADEAAADKAAADKAAADKAAADKAAADKAAADEAASTPDYDKDGVREGTGEGTRPAGLDGPRDGKADNLKEIKGIGPKLEIMCNEMGFYHFDQIAAWGADEVAWVDANLKGFKGRVSRDTWVEQAKILAAGGETEFSKRVGDGDVY